jgi:hypothetical protein
VSGHDAFDRDIRPTWWTHLPLHAVRVTFVPDHDEPWVDVWHRDKGHALSEDEIRYPYTDINRPTAPTDAEWYALLGTVEVHLFSGGYESHPTGGRTGEATDWARRYGWEG